MKVMLIATGHLKESYLRQAAAEYSKRLSRYCDLKMVELEPKRLPEKPSHGEISAALKSEGEAVLRQIPAGSQVIALCIEGKKQTSEQLAATLQNAAYTGRPVCFIIGSSFGLSDEVKRRADLRLSVSDMTFPHQLFRVMLLEQIYRGFKINEGGEYHK